ncbi:unnamed protein product [Arctogadus glacialis]
MADEPRATVPGNTNRHLGLHVFYRKSRTFRLRHNIESKSFHTCTPTDFQFSWFWWIFAVKAPQFGVT